VVILSRKLITSALSAKSFDLLIGYSGFAGQATSVGKPS